ncbi:ribonuclease P protein component [Sediminicurvatus halobius]|uniref:ribonuclease P protein component n=1 Tax=Sediminicurvatus halobius TaxID=2182432 RepID=UPI001E577FA9|nr:ribonuclease P protein component [Spiribacter halobius]UEX78055.1 ribonuclease P protein component [Spiribacter halobius]
MPPPGTRAFPRSARLTRPAQYRRVFQGAERFADRYFTLLAAGGAPEPRLGLAISRRVAPRAVDRNRLKRLVRESFRAQRAALPAVDAVVMARPAARHAGNAELAAALDRLWRRMAQRCAGS